MVRRDVNHPSILFWDNGNEGGWNEKNDGEFAKWDPQARTVLHPWAVFGGINTDHYERYDSTVEAQRGPDDLHADRVPARPLRRRHRRGPPRLLGRDGQEPDRGRRVPLGLGRRRRRAHRPERPHRHGRQPGARTASSGPHREKEGSFFTVKEIWSPVQVALPVDAAGVLPADWDGTVGVENGYDFTIARPLPARVAAAAVRRAGAPGGAARAVVSQGPVRLPPLAPRTSGTVTLGLPATLAPGRRAARDGARARTASRCGRGPAGRAGGGR